MINKVILMGRLTADPNFSQTQNGVAHCRFTVAVDRNFTDKSSGERQSDFISCVAWRQTAEFVDKYFTKGSEIAVEGKLTTRKWTDKEGNARSTTELAVDNVHFCGGKKHENTDTASGEQATGFTELNDADEANLPF